VFMFGASIGRYAAASSPTKRLKKSNFALI
jgi:hypothetical protein